MDNRKEKIGSHQTESCFLPLPIFRHFLRLHDDSDNGVSHGVVCVLLFLFSFFLSAAGSLEFFFVVVRTAGMERQWVLVC